MGARGNDAACGADALLGRWCGQAIALVDLDAFFASVEQLDHPEWRGKPVIVGGDPERRGVVSTASYEARRFGVRSAMPSSQARRLCPQAIWTRGRFDRYRELSARVMVILEDETPYVDRVSIDEAFIDITPGRFADEGPVEICRRIMARVAELGITCSIGLGCNKTVAKIASEQQKPRGLTVVPPGCERTFLAPLPVRAMSGIGGRAEAALARMRIRTLGELATAPPEALAAVFGSHAEEARLRASGRERSKVRTAASPREVKSVSNERTFPQDLTERSDIEAALALLAESVGARLRAQGLTAGCICVKLKYSFGEGRSAQRTLAHPTDDEHVMAPVLSELLDTIWSPGITVRLAGVAASGFDHAAGVQADLFSDLDERGAETTELRDLSVAVDGIRARFGAGAVGYGRAARFDEDLIRRDKYPSNP